MLVAPVIDKYFPAAHDKHALAPDVAMYVPTTQLEHDGAAIGEKVPGAQLVQLAREGACVMDEYKPVGQEKHVEAPELDWYVPAAQLLQLEESAPPVVIEYMPFGHAVQLAEPLLAEKAPTLQFVHALAPEGEYVPAAQLVHAIDAKVAYKPAAHVGQFEAPVPA